MKTNQILTIMSVIIVFYGCSQYKTHRLITPLPSGIDIHHLHDCTVPAAFTIDDFRWMGGNLRLKIYNKDLYDAVDISQINVGDTLIYSGNKLVISSIQETSNGLDINGGLEEGGCCLTPNGGGTYVARNWDDHATYTLLGQEEIALAQDFIIIDCGSFPEEPADTIRINQKLYIENLTDKNPDFSPLNTTVTITNEQITEINRRWIP